jgi:hypothetical protein
MPDELTWSEVPKRFALHIAIGVFMFVAVGVAAVALHLFVDWLEHHRLPGWMVVTARGLEYLLYSGDIGLFSIYVVRTVLAHGRELLTTKVE